MQTRTMRLRDPQLELFCSQAETMNWDRLPHETQQEAIRLLAKLLREHTRRDVTRRIVTEGSSE